VRRVGDAHTSLGRTFSAQSEKLGDDPEVSSLATFCARLPTRQTPVVAPGAQTSCLQ
jgi:hypothetical protein